jgi:hypothetical protein
VKVALRAFNGKIVTAWDEFQGQHPLIANRDAIGLGETFELIMLDGPTPPVPPIPPPVTGDMIPFESAQWTGGGNVTAWPITTTLSKVETHDNGFVLTFGRKYDTVAVPRWPDIVPVGWSGPVYYTIALGAKLSDGWHVAASLNVYFDQALPLGGNILLPVQYPQNLWYLDPALKAHTPEVGEPIAVGVFAGGLRGISAVSVRERSQIVTFPYATTAAGYSY